MSKFYPLELIFSSSTSASLLWPLCEYTDPLWENVPMFLAVLYVWGRQWRYCLFCAWRHVEELRDMNTFHTFQPWFQVICIAVLPFPIRVNFPSNAFCSAFTSQHLCAFHHYHYPAEYVLGTLRNDPSFLKSLYKHSPHLICILIAVESADRMLK
jgi:hypothetical protein